MKRKNGRKKEFHLFEHIKNLVHMLLVLSLLCITFRAVLCVDTGLYTGDFWIDMKNACFQAGINEIFTFIGAVGFVLFGITGIYEFLYLNGLQFLTPPAYIKIKEENYMKQAEKMMELYYQKDISFIREYEKERTDYLLQAIGIEEKQFHHINYEIVKSRVMPDKSIHALKQKAKVTVLQREFIVDQSKMFYTKKVYKKVDYFLNLYTAVYDPKLRSDMGMIMGTYLSLVLKEETTKIDYVVIPKGSNFLLGLETAGVLRRPVISVLNEERIFKDFFWDGEYDIKKKNNIVIVHDVLVTGKRIYESIEKLPQNSYNLLGIFSLVKYNHKDFHPLEDLQQHGISEKKVHSLLEVDEDLLKEVMDK